MARTRGTITDEDKDFVETWENIAEGTNGIIHLDTRGDEKHEMIQGNRTFFITTEERMITQDRIAVPELDPFMNGSFRPVTVPDSVTVESNPNALSDDEIKKILEMSDIAFTEHLKDIDSVATVRRMMEVAKDVDDISYKRFQQLESRLTDVRPLSRISTNDPHLKAFLEPEERSASTSVANSGATREPRRGRGGQSADYR